MKRSAKRKLCLLALFGLLGSLLGCEKIPSPAPEETTAATEAPTVPQETTGLTFRDSLAAVPRSYDPHSWSSDADRYVLELTAPGLYALGLTENRQDYALLPEMAAAEPVDVTAQFAASGAYGVPAEAEWGYAFIIDLRPDAVWQDGSPIDGEAYVYSMKQLLDSGRKNSRASAFCGGALSIAGGYHYYMQDRAGSRSYLTLEEAGYGSVAEAQAAGITHFYVDMDGFWGLDCGWKAIGDETLFRDPAVPEGEKEDRVSAKYLYTAYLSDSAPFAAYQRFYVGIEEESIPETDWSEVGFFASGDHQITVVLDAPVSVHYLMYNLTGSFLVPKQLYEAGDYGSAPERYLSCGPYQLDSANTLEVVFSRNQRWYGYQDSRYRDQYQTDRVVCRILPDHARAMEAFRAGELDTVTLTGEDMAQYGSDPALVRVPQSYTTKLTFNSDFAALEARQSEGINKTILSDPDFRRGIALAVDRGALIARCMLQNEPGYGLLNSQYICDPETGLAYRDTPQAQAVLAPILESNPADAAGFIRQAYERALNRGTIGDQDVVELEFLVYSQDEIYRRIGDFLQDTLDTAVAGTPLEGRARIRLTVAEDYYAHAQLGHFEVILSTLGGSVMDPYGMLQYYCREELRFEYGFDPATESCTVTLEEKPVTMTCLAWYRALTQGQYRQADREIRLTILAELERRILESCCCVSLYSRNTAVLTGERIHWGTGTGAVRLAGTGGIRYVTYRNDDP